MIKDRLISKLIRYSSFFRVYADCYHEGRRIRGKGERKPQENNNSLSGIGSLKDLVHYAEEHGSAIYGKDLMLGYTEDPDNTILLVSHEMSLSGAPFAVLNLALVLKKNGWQTVIVSPEDGCIGAYAADHGIPSMYIPNLYRAGFISAIKDLFAIVMANTIVSAPVVKELDGTDTPVMWWIHETATSYTMETAKELPRKLSDNVHVCCAGTYARSLLASRFPGYSIENLPCSVKDTTPDPSQTDTRLGVLSEERRTFICVGLIERRKGQDILLEAIDMLPDNVRENSLFVIVGKVGDSEIKKQIVMMQRKYPDRILFYEGLGHDEIFEMYRETDFLICASRDETGPLVVAEALSQEKPCISSRNTGNAEVIKHYGAGFTYANNDPRRLSRLIECACQMPCDEYLRMSANARKAFEEEFSEEEFGKKLTEIMKKITGEEKYKDSIG